jgi:(2Fe-2S) ferredoxin
MKTLTRADLETYSAQPWSDPGDWIRVQCDTGGIAAGAEEIFQELTRQTAAAKHPVAILRTGSTGYSFADPVVEVQASGLPRIFYGRMTPALVPRLLEEHVAGRRLLDDHLIAPRQRALAICAPVTHILVRDTGAETGGKTEFFQFSLQEELKRAGLADRVQVVRALDLGLYQAGCPVPSPTPISSRRTSPVSSPNRSSTSASFPTGSGASPTARCASSCATAASWTPKALRITCAAPKATKPCAASCSA